MLEELRASLKWKLFVHIFSPNSLEKIWILLVKHIITTIHHENKEKNNSGSRLIFRYNILLGNGNIHEPWRLKVLR